MGNIEQYDEKSYWRCPPLGGPVTFKHCRRVNNGLPCGRIAKCWSGKIEILEFLRENYTKEELEKALSESGKGRLAPIFETLDRVANENQEDG